MDTNKIFKSSIAELKNFDDNERSVVGIYSSATIDRDDDIILPANISDKDYTGTMLLQHNPSWVVAKSLWRKVEGENYIGKTQFAETLLGDETYYLYKNGFQNCFSIGFIPLEAPTFKDNIRLFGKISLLEISCVSVPANPNAVTLDFVKSLKSNEWNTEYMKQYVLNNWAEEIKAVKSEYEIIKNDLNDYKGSLEFIKSFESKYSNTIDDVITEIHMNKTKKENQIKKEFLQAEIKKAFLNYK